MSLLDNVQASTDPTTTDDVNAGYAVGSEWYNASSGVMWKCVDATANAANWIRLMPGTSLWPVGYYRIPDFITTQNTGIPVAAKMYFHPIKIDHRVVIDRIAIRVTAVQAGSKCRLGIYTADQTTGLPASLVMDGGEKLTDTTNGDHTLTVNQALKPGTYWTASLFTGSGTLPTCVRIGGSLYGRIPTTTLDEIFSGTPYRYMTGDQSYGALPSTAPSVTADSGTVAPIVALRRGS